MPCWPGFPGPSLGAPACSAAAIPGTTSSAPPAPPTYPPCPARLAPNAPCQPATANTAGAASTTPPHFDACVALYPYAFPADRLVQALKYGHQLALAPWFGQQLAALLAGNFYDLAMPLPLHPSRLRERGFNQSGEILRPLAQALGIPTDYRHCTRRRATAIQAELPHKARARNVRNAFECDTDYTGKSILLVDDVLTTGETLSECARTLKLHGARQVTVAVVARALRH